MEQKNRRKKIQLPDRESNPGLSSGEPGTHPPDHKVHLVKSLSAFLKEALISLEVCIQCCYNTHIASTHWSCLTDN